ncbi:hypothetical protein DFJ63DRAFT_314824 [Scheffersomyces coipomensis]|uniref:uncharacterized protein n=1 Tax=Scheffersomyces coipomensis TaxID=1788519 RepID=UPI00315C65A6
MSDEVESTPEIPRRPKRLVKVTSSSSDTSLTTSLEPVIPQRPNRKKVTMSESSEQPESPAPESIEISQTEDTKSATPTISSRPSKTAVIENEPSAETETRKEEVESESPSQTPSKDSETAVDFEDTKEEVKAETPSIPERPAKTPIIDEDVPAETDNVKEVESSDLTSKQIEEESDSALTSELPDSSLEKDEDAEKEDDDEKEIQGTTEVPKVENDGETTPGNSNTKVSFKDDVDDLSGVESATSFNDDIETVLQEGESTSVAGEQPVVNEEETKTFTKDCDESPPGLSNVEETPLVENDSKIVEVEVTDKADSKEDIAAEIDDSKTKEAISSIPSIPIRPSKRPIGKTHIVDRSDAESPSLDASNTDSIDEQTDKTATTTESSHTSESSVEEATIPQIPVRPSKPSSLHEAGSKPKPPPPKPKKLSSKIAAFQQMFNQETPLQPLSKSPSDFVKKDRLSNDKMKFAESLKGMMGMGVPMPGMVNPAMVNPLLNRGASDQQSKEEEKVNEPTSESTKLGKTAARPRGPRGKKLPKALKEPVNIEQDSKFKLHTYNLWDVSFKKNIPKEESLESTDEITTPEDNSNEKVLMADDDQNELHEPKNVLNSNEPSSAGDIVKEEPEDDLQKPKNVAEVEKEEGNNEEEGNEVEIDEEEANDESKLDDKDIGEGEPPITTHSLESDTTKLDKKEIITDEKVEQADEENKSEKPESEIVSEDHEVEANQSSSLNDSATQDEIIHAPIDREVNDD